MSYLLFIDESGGDHNASPYEVLAGVAVHDRTLWNLVCDIQDAEQDIFGTPIADSRRELKARRLLKTKTFRLAQEKALIPVSRRAALAAEALRDGANATREEIIGLSQAKIAFCRKVLELCNKHNTRFFASIVHPRAPRPAGTELRKDYSYLFQRFFYFVEGKQETGLVVMDELEAASARLLIGQMSRYFRETRVGKTRSERIMPEPLCVHSDLTTGVQLADVVAYIVSWNVRIPSLTAPARGELDEFGARVLAQRYWAMRLPFKPWSFAVIDDLRPRSERDLDSRAAVR